MKTITLNIDDSKYSFVIDLLKKFDFIKIVEEKDVLTDSQKRILDKRLNDITTGKVDTVDWEDVKDFLK